VALLLVSARARCLVEFLFGFRQGSKAAVDRERMMISKLTKRAGIFSIALMFAFPAQSAVLEALQGGVLVSRGGSSYQLVDRPTQLRAGDSVLANPGGSARVVFENGCAVDIQPGMVFTVGEAPPCDSVGGETTGSTDYTTVAVGAAVVAGGVGLALALGGGGGDGDGGVPLSGH
jgi:hypothetical protein